MTKRQISILFCVLLALVSIKAIFDGDSSSSNQANLTREQGIESPVNSPSPQGQSTALPNSNLGIEPPMKLASQLIAGGRQWNLVFSDSSLAVEVRRRIAYDLNLVFGHLPLTVIDTLPMPIEVGGRQLDRRVRFEGEGRKWSKALEADEFGCLFRGASDAELYVPKTVVDAYRKAINLERQNQTAYQRLDRFLERMTEVKQRPFESVRALFVVADNYKSAEAALATMSASGFAEAWGGKHYREASILDVSATLGTPLEKFGSLTAKTYVASSGKLDDLPLLIYSNGDWKFLLQRPPT